MLFQLQFGSLALADVAKGNDSPNHFLIDVLRIGPVLDRKRCAIGAPKHFIISVTLSLRQECLENTAVFDGEVCSIQVLCVNLGMHILAD